MNPEKADKTRQDLRLRTRQFALRVITLVASLPKSGTGRVISSQILRSGTSVGANYAEAFRSRSKADYINKHQLCLQELEETLYWLELLTDAGVVKPAKLGPLKQEADELIAIFVSIIKSSRSSA
ncbi:MAG: four helix bundle protein [Calditrichaeota bacterium]|nr:four helix bundle protein [Calditrichota bacterium]